jgi:hypothetical protein
VYELLVRTRYDADQKNADMSNVRIGIKELLDTKVYTAAFPLHEVMSFFNGFNYNIFKTYRVAIKPIITMKAHLLIDNRCYTRGLIHHVASKVNRSIKLSIALFICYSQ